MEAIFYRAIESSFARYDLPPDIATQLKSDLYREISRELSLSLERLEELAADPLLFSLSIRELKKMAGEKGVKNYSKLTKPELVAALAKVGGAHPTATLQADRA